VYYVKVLLGKLLKEALDGNTTLIALWIYKIHYEN